MSKITAQRIGDQPLITSALHPDIGENINGPSVIEIPSWVPEPLGRYYMYFAAHEGHFIRLAYANELTGPWRYHQSGCLHVKDSLFCSTRPDSAGPRPDWVAPGRDWLYPHVASPDVHIDHVAKQFKMYYHGLLPSGDQMTRLALSDDGISFTPMPELLGRAYFRVFNWQDQHYAISIPDIVSRSRDGNTDFVEGPRLGIPAMRHTAVLVKGSRLHIIWSEIGDMPERLYHGTIDLTKDWMDWRIEHRCEILRPKLPWEGSDIPLVASVAGAAYERKQELRDPCIFAADGTAYLFYAGAGEAAIGLATIEGF